MPAITKPNLHFDATTYTGTGSALSVTNGGFQPDLIWIKPRSIIGSHGLFDSVRGVSKSLRSHDTRVEDTSSAGNDLTAFNSNGFSVGTSSNIDTSTNGATVVAWQWKAGGTAVTNTSGTLTSQVSVNATAGFSVVTYTGTVSYPQTIGHGLGVVPQFIIVKDRSRATNWAVYHVSVGNTKALYLNGTDAAYADGGFWNNTSPSSTVFTGDNGVGYTTNGATDNYVAYCWTPIAGYSAFGSYTGNASTDGPFVYTGFKPKFLMIKRTDATNSWVIQDTTRSTYNVSQNNIYANSTAAEASYSSELTDILSNGFKQRNTGVSMNASGGTYVYAAFAEAPFKYANAR
jgi:hypothetical protein